MQKRKHTYGHLLAGCFWGSVCPRRCVYTNDRNPNSADLSWPVSSAAAPGPTGRGGRGETYRASCSTFWLAHPVSSDQKKEQQRGGNPWSQICTEKEVEGEWTLAAGCEQCQARSSCAGAQGTRRVSVLQSKVCFGQDPGATKAAGKLEVQTLCPVATSSLGQVWHWCGRRILSLWSVWLRHVCFSVVCCLVIRTARVRNWSKACLMYLRFLHFCYFERRNFSCLGDQSHWLTSKIVFWSIVIAVAWGIRFQRKNTSANRLGAGWTGLWPPFGASCPICPIDQLQSG